MDTSTSKLRSTKKSQPLATMNERPARRRPPKNPWADLFVRGLRQVDFNVLAWKMWCENCDEPLSLRNVVEDKLDKGELDLRCRKCQGVICVPLGENVDPEENLTKVEELFIKEEIDSDTLVYEEADVAMDIVFNSNTAERDDQQDCARQDSQESGIRIMHLTFGKREEPPRKRKPKPHSRSILRPRTEITTEQTSLTPGKEVSSGEPQWLLGEEQDSKFSTAPESGSNDNFEDDGYEDEPYEDEEYDIPSWACRKIKNFPFRCGYCSQLMATLPDLLKHKNKFHPEYKQQICWCGKSFPVKGSLQKHVSYNHDQRRLCHLCGTPCRDNNMFLRHVNEKHDNSESLMCQVCSKIFKTDFKLNWHLKYVHSSVSFACQHCDKCFNSKLRLKRHMALHTKIYDFLCPICPAKFTRADNMKAHIRNNHHYVCSVCAENFTSALAAKEHVKQMHSEEEVMSTGIPFGFQRITKFACSTCGMCLASKQALQLHGKKHLESNFSVQDRS